jgi:hypothetical protein
MPEPAPGVQGSRGDDDVNADDQRRHSGVQHAARPAGKNHSFG